jgi:hypothetical protein
MGSGYSGKESVSVVARRDVRVSVSLCSASGEGNDLLETRCDWTSGWKGGGRTLGGRMLLNF